MRVSVFKSKHFRFLRLACPTNAKRQAAHSFMWEQSFMSAQPDPIKEPVALAVLEDMYNEEVAITNLMLVLVSPKE